MLPKTTPTCPAISGVLATPFRPVSQMPKNGNPGDTPFFYNFCILPTHPGLHPGVPFCHTHISKLVMLLLPPPFTIVGFTSWIPSPPLLCYYTKHTPLVKIKT